jgi:DNA gyrase inhibitor GyrI
MPDLEIRTIVDVVARRPASPQTRSNHSPNHEAEYSWQVEPPEKGMKAETIIGPVTIVQKPDRPYVGIRFQTPFDGMFAVTTLQLKALRAWSKANGLQDDGPYFLRYYHCDMSQTMDVEAGFLTAASPDHPEIKPGLLPGGKYASLTYRGNGLRGNQALMKWGFDTGTRFEPIDPTQAESYVSRYEAYLTDYRLEPRKLLWDVELSIKIAG